MAPAGGSCESVVSRRTEPVGRKHPDSDGARLCLKDQPQHVRLRQGFRLAKSARPLDVPARPTRSGTPHYWDSQIRERSAGLRLAYRSPSLGNGPILTGRPRGRDAESRLEAGAPLRWPAIVGSEFECCPTGVRAAAGPADTTALRGNARTGQPQICQSNSSGLCRAFLLRMLSCFSSYTTSELGATLCMRKTLAPMVEFAPMTVSPPRMVELG